MKSAEGVALSNFQVAAKPIAGAGTSDESHSYAWIDDTIERLSRSSRVVRGWVQYRRTDNSCQ